MTPTESTEEQPTPHYRNAADDAFEANPAPLMKAAAIDMSPGAFMEVESTEPAGRSEEEALAEVMRLAGLWNGSDRLALARAILAAGYRSPAQVREARAEGWDECVRLNGLSSALGLPRRANPYRADSLSTDGGEGRG